MQKVRSRAAVAASPTWPNGRSPRSPGRASTEAFELFAAPSWGCARRRFVPPLRLADMRGRRSTLAVRSCSSRRRGRRLDLRARSQDPTGLAASLADLPAARVTIRCDSSTGTTRASASRHGGDKESPPAIMLLLYSANAALPVFATFSRRPSPPHDARRAGAGGVPTNPARVALLIVSAWRRIRHLSGRVRQHANSRNTTMKPVGAAVSTYCRSACCAVQEQPCAPRTSHRHDVLSVMLAPRRWRSCRGVERGKTTGKGNDAP